MISRDNGMISIDGEKLRIEIVKKVTKPSVMARELGFSDAYFTKVCNKGRIRKSTLVMLEEKYGIKYEDIQPDAIVEPEPEPETVDFANTIGTLKDLLIQCQPVQTDYDALELAIRKGVRAGITDILIDADTRATLIEVIKNAHKQAIRENLKERIQEQGGKLR